LRSALEGRAISSSNPGPGFILMTMIELTRASAFIMGWRQITERGLEWHVVADLRRNCYRLRAASPTCTKKRETMLGPFTVPAIVMLWL